MNAPRRWALLGMIGVAVMALHAVFLIALGPGWFDPEALPAPAVLTLQVRSVPLAATVRLPVPPVAPPAAPRALTAVGEVRAVPRHDRPAGPPATSERVEPSVPDDALVLPPVNVAPAATVDAVVDIPVYATQLPPAGQWRYRLQRGLAVGEAELRWMPQSEARYELHLEGRVAGLTLLDWVSQGQLDAAGVAPDRFAVRRRGRDRQAANFQREAAKITFSGPTIELPLLPGAQDRLSWMIQLPAIVAAAPERFVAGTSVVLFVAGARGDADVWTFAVQGLESVGATLALKLVREPRRPYDTRAEVWLDPADHYLPLRAVQTPSGGGAALELMREKEPR